MFPSRKSPTAHTPARILAVLALLGTVFAADALQHRRLPRFKHGILDEIAHASTGLLLLLALRGFRRDAFQAAAIAGSVFIDVDHVPAEIEKAYLQPGHERPRTHSLGTTVALLGLAMVLERRQRAVAAGLALGVEAHLVRDLATGKTGVPLGWPLAQRSVRLPYRAG